MIHKAYELVCPLPADAALARIEGLFSAEYVKYRAANLCVTSTETPVVLFNFDRRGYSRANWVGVNPFKYVSDINVRCEPSGNGSTKVIVRVNRLRAFLMVAWWAAISLLMAFFMPQPGGTIFFVGSVSASWFVTVSFLGGCLIKKEIGDHLRNGKHPHR